MTSSCSFLILILFSILVSSCGFIGPQYNDTELASVQEASCGFIQNSKGYRVSWHGQLPVVFYFEKSVPTEFRAAILKAANDWNTTTGKNLIAISGTEVTSAAE